MENPVERPPVKRDLSKDEKATLRTQSTMESFMAHPGWKVYTTILEHHLNAKRTEYEAPAETSLDGIAQILRGESAKGAIIALRLALGLPGSMVTAGHNLRVQLGLPTAGEDDYE